MEILAWFYNSQEDSLEMMITVLFWVVYSTEIFSLLKSVLLEKIKNIDNRNKNSLMKENQLDHPLPPHTHKNP